MFETALRWVSDDRILMFGWTIHLIKGHCQHVFFFSCMDLEINKRRSDPLWYFPSQLPLWFIDTKSCRGNYYHSSVEIDDLTLILPPSTFCKVWFPERLLFAECLSDTNVGIWGFTSHVAGSNLTWVYFLNLVKYIETLWGIRLIRVGVFLNRFPVEWACESKLPPLLIYYRVLVECWGNSFETHVCPPLTQSYCISWSISSPGFCGDGWRLV